MALRRTLVRLVVLAAAMLPALGATRLLVSVADPKSGRPIGALQAADFAVTDGDRVREVEAVQAKTGGIDVLLLLDASMVGDAVQGAAPDLIAQLDGKEQMALVTYDSSASMVLDFTSSKQALSRALSGIKYGNSPRALDGIYAAVDGGFEHATLRRVVLLLTAGLEGSGRVNEKSVIELARKNSVSIYPLFLKGYAKGMFERLARQTGGVALNLKDISKGPKAGAAVFETMRSYYELTISGNLPPTEKLRVEVKRPGKYFTSALVVD
ncbi:MAG: VWA domain-containing protein [Bryobacteraceae bacterium]